MALDPADLPSSLSPLLTERHFAMLTTLRPDGSPHVVAVGFTWEAEARLVRVITRGHSRKVRNLRERPGWAAVGAVAGPVWLSLSGPAVVSDDPARVAEAVRRYAERYGQPRLSAERVVIEISVDEALGSNR